MIVRQRMDAGLAKTDTSANMPGHELTWSQTGQQLAVVDQVRRIAIAGLQCRRGKCGVPRGQPQESLEAQDAIERLRSITKRLLASAPQ